MQLWMVVAGGLGLLVGAVLYAVPDNPVVRLVLRPDRDEWDVEWNARERLGTVRSVGGGFAVGGLALLLLGLVL